MSARLNFSLRHAVLLCYLLLVLLVVVLLIGEWSHDQPAFSLANAHLVEGASKKTLVLRGDNFHSGINGVLAKKLVNEEAFLSHQFTNVPFRVFDLKGNLGLISFSVNKIVSVSFSEEGKPRFLDTMTMPGIVGEIKIIGNKALVGLTRGEGVRLIDLSDPGKLKVIEHFPFSGSVNSMVTLKNTFYFTGVRLGLVRLDLAEEHPVPEVLITMEKPWRLAVQGDRLVVGTLKGHVSLFEIDATGDLVEVNTLDFPGQVRGVAFTRETLNVALSDNSLEVFNLSSWPSLTQPGRLQLPSPPLAIKSVPGRERVIVSLIGNGLLLVDVNQETSPLLAGWLKLPRTYKVFALDSEKMVGTSIDGLDFISFEKITSGVMSKLAPDAMISDDAFRLRSWRNFVYGFDKRGLGNVIAGASVTSSVDEAYLPIIGGQGITLYAQDQEGQLQGVGSVAINEGALEAGFNAGYLYVSHSAGIRIFSVKASGEMVVVGELPISVPISRFAILDSGTLMVATQQQGVLIVDVSDPTKPKQVSRLTLPGNMEGSMIKGLLVDGERVYLTQGRSGLYVVDISSLQHPEVLQLVDTPGYASAMALHDGFIFIADALEGFFVVDVSNQKRVFPVGSFNVPIRINEIAAASDGLIVSSSSRGGTMKLPYPQRLQGLRVVSDKEVRVDIPAVENGQTLYLYDEVTSARADVGLD